MDSLKDHGNCLREINEVALRIMGITLRKLIEYPKEFINENMAFIFSIQQKHMGKKKYTIVKMY